MVFYKDMSSKNKAGENMGLQLSGAGDLVTKDMEGAKLY